MIGSKKPPVSSNRGLILPFRNREGVYLYDRSLCEIPDEYFKPPYKFLRWEGKFVEASTLEEYAWLKMHPKVVSGELLIINKINRDE